MKQPWNLLADHHGTKIDEKYILKFEKGAKVVKEVQESCKVVHFSSEWNFNDVLGALKEFDQKDYKNLFIFVIGCLGFETSCDSQPTKEPPKKKRKINNRKTREKLKKILLEFGLSRPMILQLSSVNNDMSFYYKDGESTKFQYIEKYQNLPIENNEFQFVMTLLLDGNFENFEDTITSIYLEIANSSSVLKFLRSLNLCEKFFGSMVLEVTKTGSKSCFLASLDAPFENDCMVLTRRCMGYISNVFEKDKSEISATSVLLTAVDHSNTNVADYLIFHWTHLIQQLPFDHQVTVSTAAFETNQLNVLCDLLDIVDYPFPKNYVFDGDLKHERLRKIILERKAFTNAIKEENFKKVYEFMDDHLNLKFAYSIDNDTASKQAIELKKFGVFYFLRLLGCQGEDCDNNLNKIDEEDKKKAKRQAEEQRKTNVKAALVNVHKSVLLLATRSVIHNRGINKEQEAEYRQKILNWLQDIHKIAPEMIDVAASCEHLKNIFDFDSNRVENVSLTGPNALGIIDPVSKWIFVGAKLSDKKREQQIKGVLAHELCHYVMCLVYDNQFLPYFGDDVVNRDEFDEIVTTIDKWSADDSEYPDDKCNENISTVFTSYEPEKFHLELIVRSVQNQVEFDDNKDHSDNLEREYKILYDFWKNHVLPDLLNYCKKNPKVIKLNKLVELLPRLLNKELTTKGKKDIETVFNNKLAVVTTNVPTLLFLDIVKNLKKKCGILLDSQNFFTEPQPLNNEEVWNDFEKICKEAEQMNIFVDSTKGVPEYLENIFVNKELNFIFVVSNDAQREKLTKIFEKQMKIKQAIKMEINYNWNDLTEESQKLLLTTEISFQNNSGATLNDLFRSKSHLVSETLDSGMKVMPDLSAVFDDQLLNMIVDEEMLTINSVKEQDEKFYQFLNIERKYLNKVKSNQYLIQEKISTSHSSNSPGFNTDKIDSDDVSVSQSESDSDNDLLLQYEKELVLEVNDQLFVIISDMAGNGKSWAMKNLTKILRIENPTSWVNYVDLKQFIKEFKAQMTQDFMPEFSTFVAEKILKTEYKFESKIFQKLYKDGKVCILFDGFDEIAPNCAEFVSNLAQSFQSNGGNQLWIATRDYFEVDLKKKLNTDAVYGLEKMDDDNGVELIARRWMLMDLGDKKKDMSIEELNQHFEVFPKFQYEDKAMEIVEKLKINRYLSVGMPQMYKMIAGAYKDEENIDELKESLFYEKFIKYLYRRWSGETGEIRKEASIESQNLEFNFWRLHQYHAIAGKFPELAKILFPGYNRKDWKVEEVVACGILSIKNGEIYFVHETLREYFVADSLAKALRNEEINDKVLEVLADVLTLEQHKIIRMFLNDLIDSTTLVKIQPKMDENRKKYVTEEVFMELFEENRENLVDYFLLILNDFDYENVKGILECSFVDNMDSILKNPKHYYRFQEFLCKFLTSNDLKDLIEKQEMSKRIIEDGLGIRVFADFVLKIESKTGREFVQEELRNTINQGWLQFDRFNFLFQVTDLKDFKFQEFLQMLQKFLSPTEVMEFLTEKDDIYDENILLACVKKRSKEMLRTLWTEINNYLKDQKVPQDFRALVMQQYKNKISILYVIANIHNFEFHLTFWELLLNTFKDHLEELKDFVLQEDFIGNNFVHQLIQSNNNPEIIEWTFEMLKSNLNDSQLQEIIQSRGAYNRILIHSAAFGGHNIEIFKLLWKFFRSSCKSEQEFWIFLKEVDKKRQDILNSAGSKSSAEVFNFLVDEFDKNCSEEEVTKMLSDGKCSVEWNPKFLHFIKQNKLTVVFKAVLNICNKFKTGKKIKN